MDLLDLFGKFQLDMVADSWVESIWEKDFCQEKEFPSDYEMVIEDINILDLMSTLSEAIKEWLADAQNLSDNNSIFSDSSVERKSWQTLISKNVDHKALLAVISIFIKEDVKALKNLKDVNLALEASRLYFMILSIHGAHIFNVFNSTLFCQAIDTLRILRIISSEKTNIQREKKRGKGKKNHQGNENYDEEEKGKVKNKKGLSHQGNEDENDEDNDNRMELGFNNVDKIKLIEISSAVLDDLAFCLQNLELKNEKDCFVQTINNLVTVGLLEKTSSNILQVRPKENTLAYLSYKSFNILDEFCDPAFGNVEDTVRFIMRSILPNLSPNEQDFLNNTNTSRSLSAQRESLLNFVYRLVSKVKEASYSGVMAAVQQLCVRTPDKADIRNKFVHLIVSILEHLPPVLFNRLLIWILSLCHAESVKNRIVGIDILASLLNSAHQHPNLYPTVSGTRKSSASNSSSLKNVSPKPSVSPRRTSTASSHSPITSACSLSPTHSSSPAISISSFEDQSFSQTLQLMLSTVISKCADVSPTVKTRALSSLSSIVLNKQFPIEEIILDTFVNPYMGVNTIDSLNMKERKLFNFKSFFKSRGTESVTNGGGILDLHTNSLPGGTVIMDLVEKLSQDEKVFVKKAALSTLCNVCLLSSKWLTPKRIELMTQSCKNISLIVRKQMTSSLTDLLLTHPMDNQLVVAWVDGVFPLIGDNEIKSQEKVLETASKLIIDNMDYYNTSNTSYSLLPWKIINLIRIKGKRKLFRIVCRYWASVNRIRPAELKILRSHLGTENNLSALFLLVCIAEYQNIYDNDCLIQAYYEKIQNCSANTSEFESQLIMEAIFLSLNEMNEENKYKLCSSIKESLNLFSVPLSLISRFMDIYQHTYPEEIKDWTSSLIKDAEMHLNKIIKGDPKGTINENVLCQYIYTLGEASMTSPKVVSKEVIESLITLIDIYDERNDIAAKWQDVLSPQTLSVIVITLGKLCLQDQLLAKSIVPVLGALLDIRTASKIKINSLVALTDLCVRFTSLVEAYLGDMCVCLKDKDLDVRKMVLTLLMQLIKEDYVKLRGPYFFYLLCMLEDPSLEIREETSSFLINCALTKQGNIMATFFIQALYFFNNYEGQNQYTRIVQGPQEQEAFCISGTYNREIRRRLYRFMLEHMQDDHRFRITHKLSTDILGEVCNGVIQLDGNGSLLLEDALFCLACDEIRLVHMNQTKDLADDGSGEVKCDEIIGNMCKRTIISQALKKDYVDVVIPTILSLKTKLKELKSPLVRDLRVALRELMKDFKDEINEILENDSEAAAEVAMELRKIELEEQAQLSPSTNRQQEQVVLLGNIFVQCERLSHEVLSQCGYNLPLHKNVSNNQEDNDASENAPVECSTNKRLSNNTLERGSTINHQNNLSTAYSESGTHSIPTIDNSKLLSPQRKDSPNKKLISKLSSSPNEAERPSIRPSQSSLSTAYGESSVSILHSGRDSTFVHQVSGGEGSKKRSISEDSVGNSESTVIEQTSDRSENSSSKIGLTSNSSGSTCDASTSSSNESASPKKAVTNKKNIKASNRKRKQRKH